MARRRAGWDQLNANVPRDESGRVLLNADGVSVPVPSRQLRGGSWSGLMCDEHGRLLVHIDKWPEGIGTAPTAGPTGPVGPAGARGPQGEVGPVGPAGPRGDVGATGGRGDVGSAGPAGSVGPSGAPGARGETGPAGPAGLKGDTGATGPQGPAGSAGAKGDTGPAGPQGPAGPAAVQPANVLGAKVTKVGLTLLSGQFMEIRTPAGNLVGYVPVYAP